MSRVPAADSGTRARLQLLHDQRLEQLRRHLLWQAALVQAQLRMDHPDTRPPPSPQLACLKILRGKD
jgi:hypothetical protein